MKTTGVFREVEEPRRVREALAVSLAVHATIILLVAALAKVPLPTLDFTETEFEEPVELTLFDPPLETAADPALEPAVEEPPPQFVQLPSGVGEDAAVEEELLIREIQTVAPFEAARETRAGSPVPGDGKDALPAQEGKEQESLQIAPAQPPSMPLENTPPAGEASAEMEAPLPHLNELIGTLETPVEAPPAEPVETPDPAPTETLFAAPVADSEREGEIALWELPARPAPVERSPEMRLAPQPATRLLDEPVRVASGSSEASFASPTKVEGSIDEFGPVGVEAAATASAVYKQRIVDLINAAWQPAIQRRVGLLQPGTVRVMFSVDKSGKIGDLRVVSNSSNPIAGTLTLNAISSTELPPIPETVFESLPTGKLQIDFFFSINE